MRRWCTKGAVVVASLALLWACATGAPQLVRYPEDEVPAGYPAYFAADIAGNRELLRNVARALAFEQSSVIERTDRIAGGLSLEPGGSRLSAVAYGAFPRGLVEFSLSLNGELERSASRVRPGQVLFRQREGNLELAVTGEDVLYVSSGEMEYMLSAPPRGRAAIRRDTYSSLVSVGGTFGPEAVIVFEDPGAGLLSRLGVQDPSVPLTSVSLALRVEKSSLFLDGRFTMRTQQEAALFSRLGRLFVILFVRALGLDPVAAREQAVITAEGNRVFFSNIPMSEQELVMVISTFTGQP